MPKPEKREPKLPDKLLRVPNPDKVFHEAWTKGRNKLNLPHPVRAVLMGPPHRGKTEVVKNLILRANPPFKKIFVIHCDSTYTQEYDDVEAEMLDNIPAPDEWEGMRKTLVVLDDLEFKQMSKEQKKNLDRLFGYVSTHKNISVYLCAQDCFNVPPIVRRCANLWILWKGNDMDSMCMMARKSGLKKEAFHYIFDNLMPEQHDSLWIDTTTKTPYPLRKNGFELITKKANKPEEFEEE